MTTFFRHGRVMRVVFGAVFGLVAAGCEKDMRTGSTDTGTSSTEAVTIDPAASNSTNAVDPVTTNSVTTAPAATDTPTAVLNDDPNCELVLKYQDHDIPNNGQVHYVNRVLVSAPFGSANPICVQYNDAQTGEVTLWKNPSSTGERVDTLPSDRVIDKIVVWYQ